MPPKKQNVFINIPFDKQYERLYIALIAGLVGLGCWPRSTLEVPPQHDRLRRIYTLVQSCGSSIHDLSRVQLSHDAPRCPRFNMPFEAGLAVALFLPDSKRKWFLLEAQPYRVQKSISDLNGYEVFIHEGKVEGMLVALLDMFPLKPNQPGPLELRNLYKDLRKVAEAVKRENLNDLFRPNSFDLLRFAADEIAKRQELLPKTSKVTI